MVFVIKRRKRNGWYWMVAEVVIWRKMIYISSIFTVFTGKIDEFAVKLNVSSTVIYIVIGLIIFIVIK